MAPILSSNALEETILRLCGEDVTEIDPILDTDSLMSLKPKLKWLASRLKLKKESEAGPEDWHALRSFLYAASYFDEDSISDYNNDKGLNVSGILTMISTERNCFPEDYRRVTATLYAKFEELRWGEVESEPEGETVDSKGKKRKRSDGGSGVVSHPAPANHHIYGTNGIMRHIIATPKEEGFSYSLDKTVARKSFKVYGANGFAVGDAWAMQIAALRDGVHGHAQAGISGHEEGGAWSIILSGTYHKHDIDNGDSLVYSMPNAATSTDRELDMNHPAIKIVGRSLHTGNPVRVIRTKSAKWEGGPKAGLRYDGLYKVVTMISRKNKKGGRYAAFRLIRLPDQAAIDTEQPSEALIKKFKRVKDGY